MFMWVLGTRVARGGRVIDVVFAGYVYLGAACRVGMTERQCSAGIRQAWLSLRFARFIIAPVTMFGWI